MILGLLSDTHDRPAAMAAGLAALRGAGAEFFIHCGDIGGQAMLDVLAGTRCLFVWGNTDFDRQALARYADKLGITCGGTFAELELEEKRIAVTHGDDAALMRRATGGAYDYLFHGHTHFSCDQPGRPRIVNPGALHRAGRKTVAVVDLARDTVRHLAVHI